MRIVNADVFITLLFWRGLINEVTCNEIKRAAYQSEITWNEDAKKVIKILEDDTKESSIVIKRQNSKAVTEAALKKFIENKRKCDNCR